MEISSASVGEIAEEAGIHGITALKSVDATLNPVLGGLMKAIFPNGSRELSPLFLDQMSVAIGWHLTRQYGDAWKSIESRIWRLPFRKERSAKELLANNLDGNLTIQEIARECGLSSSAFLRGFKLATGVRPHQWLMNARLEKARDWMATSNFSLAEIASLSGFLSEAYFCRLLSGRFGETPKTSGQASLDARLRGAVGTLFGHIDVSFDRHAGP